MKKLLSILLFTISLNVLGGEVIIDGRYIGPDDTVYVERIQMYNATLINYGTMIFDDDFDFEPCYNTGVTFINYGRIECNNFKNNINQWQWLSTPVQFKQYGAFICHQDFDCIVSAYLVLSFGENSSTVAKNVNIQKYGNSDLELLGSWKCDDIDITFNDGGRKIMLGDIDCENFTLHNNATNLQLEGMAMIEHLSGETWSGATVTVNGGLIIGDKSGNVSIKATEESLISLCYNPSSGKDYDIVSNGTVCYRIQYDSYDSYYWSETPLQENDVTGNAICKGNYVSYEECIEGNRIFQYIEEIAAADAIVNGVIYSEGEIVIYNPVGQRVASTSQEFAIASLGVGVYFAHTTEGQFGFTVK